MKSIKMLDAKINADIEHVDFLLSLATRITPMMGGERVQSSGSQHKMEDTVVKIVELKQEITEEIDAYIDRREVARKLINQYCDTDCVKLLTVRYLGKYNPMTTKQEFMTWEQIAVEMGYTYQWVSGGLHRRALDQLQIGIDQEGIEG